MTDEINYSAFIDEAMHIIVRKSLAIAAQRSLPGNHHFFISFLTHFPGVALSEKLRNKYPEEMTIVLQYQFEDLLVEENGFSVVLSFDNIKEKIVVPFTSLTAFADPSVKFGLQFRYLKDSKDGDIIHPAGIEQPQQRSNSDKQESTKQAIERSGADNVIALDSFRKKH